MKKYTVNMDINDVKDRIQRLLIAIYGRAKNKKDNKDIIFYPAYKFMDIDAYYLDVTIVIRKVTNTKTIIIADYNVQTSKDNWRHEILQRVYDKIIEYIPKAIDI